ncbi:hypothetical protein JTE90_000449 [Oedothorax gibbosus]|uniref:Uncharacterized protein n=1 Tax=Oedothorax gibbosus TaxID=931172 RepID=A0AAV6UFH6_9ARAC|nr:hypothetical protein JTE90_000449 [Oedothorax gibbosus]
MGNQPAVLSVNKEDKTIIQQQLSEATADEKSVIVIKNPYFKTEVAIGMVLAEHSQHAALVAAVGSILCTQSASETFVWLGKPLAVGSVITNIGYYGLWKRCPLSKYRISTRPTIYKMLTRQEQPNTVLVREGAPQSFRLIHILTSAAALVLAFYEDVYDLSDRLHDLSDRLRDFLFSPTEAKDGDGSEI